jgi:hypothetical protein
MGEMADLHADYSLLVDDGYYYPDESDYLHLSDDELKAETARARDPKIMGIRKWPNPLSEKQRWCLANWITRNESPG